MCVCVCVCINRLREMSVPRQTYSCNRHFTRTMRRVFTRNKLYNIGLSTNNSSAITAFIQGIYDILLKYKSAPTLTHI